MADSGRLRGWKYDHANSTLEAWNNGVKVTEYTSVASGVNFIQLAPAVACADPTIAATGSDCNVGMTLDTKGTGQIILSLGGFPALNIHDANNASFVAGAGLAGQAIRLQTQDGAPGTACGTGKNGGEWTIRGGDGGVGFASCNRNAGLAGEILIAGGSGGATAASGSGNAGAGGKITLDAGDAGAVAAGTTGDIKIGGAIQIMSGKGSSTAIACGDVGGAGGLSTIASGDGGVDTGACGGTAGAGGAMVIEGGAGGASTAGIGGAGGNLDLFGGQGGTGTGSSCGGAAGDVNIHVGTTVESGGVGVFKILNNTTGLGTTVAAECTNSWTAGGAIGQVAHTTAWAACDTTASDTGVMLIKIS